MSKTYTKYDFNKVELCEGLNAEKLKELGFTNHNPKTWYFYRTISEETLRSGRFSETLNVSINVDFKHFEVDIFDEAFLQPCIPYVEYYMHKRAFEECTAYVQKGIQKCDEYIEFLIKNNVIRFV